MKTFPKGFYWGSATSAHQVEGGLTNDWSEWEQKHKNRLASQKSRMAQELAGFDVKNARPSEDATNPENYVSGEAADHFNRYEEDFEIMKSLNFNSYRFSLAWSRLEPKKGEYNIEAVNHYKKYIKSMKEKGIEPFMTIWHWTLPVWLSDEGGVESKNFPEYFEKLTEFLVEHLGDDVKYWITINEPLVVGTNGYMMGEWPPQKKNPLALIKMTFNLVKAHKKSHDVIKRYNSKLEVGIAKHINFADTQVNQIWNVIAKWLNDVFYNYWFLDKIKNHQDFVGLNHYFYNLYRLGRDKTGVKYSDLGWELFPEGIYHVLKVLRKKYNKPVYITENGLADAKDKYREWYLTESLKWLHKAIEEGVDVRGYLHWSFMDNFEWAYGFWPKFGLVGIDRENNLERKIRPSAYKYAEICRNNSL